MDHQKNPGDFHKRALTVAIYTFIVLLAALLFSAFLFNLTSVLTFLGGLLSVATVILYGILIAFILFPLFSFLNRVLHFLYFRHHPHPKIQAGLSVFLTYMILFVLMGVVLFAVVANIGGEMTQFTDMLSASLTDAREWLSERTTMPILVDVFDNAADLLKRTLLTPGTVIRYALQFLSGTYNVIIGLIISVYLLISRERLGGLCGKMMVAIFPRTAASRIAVFCKTLYTGFMKLIFTRFVVSFIISFICYLTCWAFGIPYRSIIMLILLIVNIIPFYGPVLGIALVTLLVLLLNPGKALLLFLIVLAAQILTTVFVTPRLLRRRLRPGPGITVFVVTLGYSLFGIIGALFAVPVYVVLSFQIRELITHILLRKGYTSKNDTVTVTPPPQQEDNAADGR